MPTIRIHVDHEELSALKRRAEALGVTVSELAYGALNCSMSHGKEAYCDPRIKQAVAEREGDLPRWADSARSVGIYQGKHDIGEEPGPKALD